MAVGFVPILGQVVSPVSTTIKAPVSTSISSTSTSQCQVSLCFTSTPQNSTFNPASIPNYFGTDIGTFSTTLAPSGFSFSTAPSDSLTMQVPTYGIGNSPFPNTVVWYNSTQMAWLISPAAGGHVNVYFKGSQYQSKVSIHTNLVSAQTLCIGFTSPNPIVQGSFVNQTTQTKQFLPSVRAGNEVFDWGDIPATYSPSWNFPTSAMCMNLPIGITNIDPLALDGSATNACNNTITCAATLTTTTSPDVIIVSAGLYLDSSTFSIADTSSLTWSVRVTSDLAADTRQVREYCAIAAGILTTDVITITGPAGSYFALVAFGVSGANTGGCSGSTYDNNAGMPYTDHTDAACPLSGAGGNNPCIPSFSTSNANDFIFLSSITGADTYCATGDTGFTAINSCATGGVNSDLAYKIVSATQSAVLLKYGNNYVNAPQRWATIGDAIKQAGAVNQPYLFTLIVNPSPSPEGGAIFIGAATTISSTSVLTVAAGSTSTYTLTAQEFAGYIYSNPLWSGATAVIQDTINPTQTAVLAATSTTTQSATLTAKFTTPLLTDSDSSAGSSGQTVGPDPWIAAAIVLVFVAASIGLLANKRKET